MVKESLINLISSDLVRCIFIVLINIGMCTLFFQDIQNCTPPVIENQIVLKVKNPSTLVEDPPAKKTEATPSSFRGKTSEYSFHPIILQVASKHQVDPALVKAIIKAESGYNPQAISRKGAKGLMQLMPNTAKSLGVEDVFNPEENINAGVKYFKVLLDRFNGDIAFALAAYNAGSRRVKKYQGVPPIPATQYYVKIVFKYYEHYKKKMEEKIDST